MGRAIGNLAEVVAAHGLLLGAEAAVVGGGGMQVAGLQAAPQRFLVFDGRNGGPHHAGRGGPVRVAVDAVVEQQVPGQHLAVDRLALGAGIGDLVQRLAAEICTRYSGVPSVSAMRMARLAASPSTCGGRDSGCASGPVEALGRSFCCRWKTSSPFSACTVGTAPSSRQRSKLATRVSSAAMMAFLYHEVFEAVHPSCHQLAHFRATSSLHQVMATWKP